MQQYLLGIDIGTTNIKAILFDLDGHARASAQKEYPTIIIRENWVEQDPQEWWNAVQLTIQDILASTSINNEQILALGLSCQAPSMLPVDKSFRPLRNALIWMDRRSESACGFMRDTIFNDRYFSRTGNIIDPFFILPKIIWFKENEPELFEQTYKIIQPNGFINFQLTGEISMDNIHASLSLAYDVNENCWITEVLETFGLSEELFPKVSCSHEILGNVSRRAAELTGLSEKTVVITGTVDGIAAAIEAGVVMDGDAAEMTGTSSVLLVASRKANSSKCLTSMQHAIAGRHVIFGAMSTTGASLKWIRDNLYKWDEKTRDKAYIAMDAEIESDAPLPGKIVYLPYLAGERAPIWDTNARGVFAGMTLETRRGELLRSVLEGAAFALRHNLSEVERNGPRVNQLISVGGGANSDIWMTIKASVLNRPISVPQNSAGAPLGNAILAGYAMGIYKDIASTAARFRQIKRTYDPVLEWVPYYDELFESYKAIYNSTKETIHKMQMDYSMIQNLRQNGATQKDR